MAKIEKIEQVEKKGTWMTYRPDIKVLDCTIRDGGLINNFEFHEDFVKSLYVSCSQAGVDYMELGYKSSKQIFAPSDFGPWKFCDEEAIRRIVGENQSSLKLSVMADTGRTDYHQDILNKNDSAIDLIRVATYIHQIPKAIDIINDAKQKGYETSVNLMAISSVKEGELYEALEVLAASDVDTIYLVDSFGALYSEQIRSLAKMYLDIAKESGKSIGIHAHNNQQLAYANTIEALILGVSYLDATVTGLGRGAGNCPIELLLGFLKNPKYNIRPLLQFIEAYIPDLRAQGVDWGYDLPYMITGQMNIHPKPAMDFMKDKEQKEKCLFFYDKIINETY
jgi:4-hydroxy 2-oxovalerate aldolase